MNLFKEMRKWGYLDDLYVNFDYAMDIINEDNYI